MVKRKAEGEHDLQNCRVKRLRQGGQIHIFQLSDELLLRSLSFLPIESLARCETVCRKFGRLSVDDEIWREKYYNRFVRHRARRLPILRSVDPAEQNEQVLRYYSRRAKWLEHTHLLHNSAETNWKHLYKVKHNWKRGRARKSEVQIHSKPVPAALARVCKGMLFTADADHGLRVWRMGEVIQSRTFLEVSAPSAMVVEAEGEAAWICVGFENGVVQLFTRSESSGLVERSSLRLGEKPIRSLALAWPYVLVLSASETITLLHTISQSGGSHFKCLATLHSGSALSTASLSLRQTSSTLVAGVCYAFNRFNAGWCLGLQELRMDLTGTITSNRITSSASTPLRDSLHSSKVASLTTRSASTAPFSLHPHLMRAPNSLSFCGCYILAGLPDNTLMVYTVASTDEKLEIGMGRRLWGHTSAISAAEVTSTGKAISISSKGEETRYWELEEVLTSSSLKRTSIPIESADLAFLDGVIRQRGSGVGLALKEVKQEAHLLRRFVSFDDEQAIVVGQRDQRQVVLCYDFA